MRKAPAGGIVRTSLDNTWRTPEGILVCVRDFFGGEIPFDPASGPQNPTRAAIFCTAESDTVPRPAAPGLFPEPTNPLAEARRDGLALAWDWPFFVNPPYGEELRAWLLKIEAEAKRLPSRPGVALLPCARWEQGYFTDVIAAADVVCFHRGRVAFVSSRDGAEVGGNPYASMLLGFNADADAFVDAFAPLGACFKVEGVRPRARCRRCRAALGSFVEGLCPGCCGEVRA